jgi:hypothetical protein
MALPKRDAIYRLNRSQERINDILNKGGNVF